MERVGLAVLSIAVATLLLVSASFGAMWLQPYAWHFAQTPWMLPLFVAVAPLAYIASRRRKRT